MEHREGRVDCPIAAKRDPTVLIAEDHPAMLERASGVISAHFDVVATANDGVAAVDLAGKTNPSLIVLDIRMPKLDGFSVARELVRTKSSSKIVFLTAQDDDDYISEALRVGARGYVMKRRLHSDLIPALNLALNSQLFISPYSFATIPNPATNEHVLHFYSNDVRFFQHAAELTCEAQQGRTGLHVSEQSWNHFCERRTQDTGFRLDGSDRARPVLGL